MKSRGGKKIIYKLDKGLKIVGVECCINIITT